MKKQKLILAAISIVLLSIIFASYVKFNKALSENLQVNVSIRLQEIVDPNIIAFEQQMNEQVKKVKTFADFLGQIGLEDKDTTLSLLRSAVKYNGLLRCALAYSDGSFITHDNKNEGSVSDSPFFLANMKGEIFITDPTPAVVDPAKSVLLFSAPIFKDSEVIGSIIYSYLCDDLDAIFNFEFLHDEGQMLVINTNGTVLIGSSLYEKDGANILRSLRSGCKHIGHSPESCLLLEGEHGSYNVTMEDMNSSLLVNYDKLAYNDWYMLSMVPETAAAQAISVVTKDQRDLGIHIALCVLAFVFTLVLLFMAEKKNIDPLTNVLTLDSFKRKAKKLLTAANGRSFVFIKIDVKNFKLINRIYNYEEGDRVIRNIANSLRYVLEGTDSLIARVGTDDFILLLPYKDRESLGQQRSCFIAEFRRLMGPQFTTTVTFPTGQYIPDGNDIAKPDIKEILEKVNFAHRAAKQQNAEIIVDYVENLEKEALFEKQITDKMESSLINGEFHLYLQPKYHVARETICGAEALVRWIIDGNIYLNPIDFIPVLEKNGFIVRVDLFMFRKAVEKIRNIMDRGLHPVPISVNFSRFHLDNENFVDELCAITDKYSVPRHFLEIELTESAVFGHVDRIKQLLTSLHAAGFTMSMDDFGSGYSSLALLKDLSVDTLKIDKGFFDQSSDIGRSQIVISHIVHMSKELGVSTVAEGIEEKAQVLMLRELGCDIIQGYYYSRPIPEEDFM